MPLIIIAGYPCCGKTTFCLKLASYLEAQGVKKVVIINEESESINKRSAYLESFTEKKTRGSLKSAVDHVLDAESFVILDSMNYIKGYRYELFCISRSLRTPHCCIWVESDDDLATQWNIQRKKANVEKGYDPETLLELRRRFEAPIEKNRWDFPLFRVFSKPITLLSKDDNASASIESHATTIGDKETLNGNIPRPEKLNTLSGISTAINGGDSLTPPLTSTRGQIDINCLAIDGTARREHRIDDSFEKPVNVKTSSWRPKVRTTDISVVSRTFTTLEKESIPAKSVDVTPKDSSLSASSALTISGLVPTVMPDDNEDSLDVIMSRVYLHLINVSQIAAPNSSTISVPRVHAGLLHELDRTSQNITQRIVTHQTDNVEGTPLIFQDYHRTLTLHRHVGLAELQRHRRQFVKMYSSMSQSSPDFLGSAFIDSLSSSL